MFILQSPLRIPSDFATYIYEPISGLHLRHFIKLLSSFKFVKIIISISLNNHITLPLSVPEACCLMSAMTRATNASKWMMTLALSVHRPSKTTAWRITCGLIGSATAPPPRLFP
jgi:hypothetical protein